MDYLPCDDRQKLVQFKRDGTQERVQACRNPEVELDAVQPSDCEACPLRHFTKPVEGPKPKPVKLTEVRRVIDTRPDTAATEGFPACPYRVKSRAALCCGEFRIYRVCDSPDCYQYGAEVNASICDACPLKG